MGIQARIKGFLIDLDGTVVEANKLIPDVLDALAWLREKGLPYRFVTNTTSDTSEACFTTFIMRWRDCVRSSFRRRLRVIGFSPSSAF